MRAVQIALVALIWAGFAWGDTVVHGVSEGSDDALAIIDVANSTPVSTFVHDVEIDSQAADNIVRYRMEHKLFGSLTELDSIPFLGQEGFSKLLEYGKSHGFIPALDNPFSSHHCAGESMTWHEAMVRIKAGDNGAPLGRFEILERTRECDKLMGCTPWNATPPEKIFSSVMGQSRLTLSNEKIQLEVTGDQGKNEFLSAVCSGVGTGKINCDAMVRHYWNGRYWYTEVSKAGSTNEVFQPQGLLTNSCLRLTWQNSPDRTNATHWTEVQRVVHGKF